MSHPSSRAIDRAAPIVAILAIVIMAAVSLKSLWPPTGAVGGPASFSAERAMAHVEALAAAPRPAGSAAHRAAREYIVTVPGASVIGNNKVWRKFTFPAVTTSKVRVLIHNALAGRSRLVEVEAWGNAVASSTADVRWLVSDHLGTPRMVVDQTGSLSGVTRHDYLPFGEELYAGTGGRTSTQGYSAADNVRQKFTGYERDGETGLDYARARYLASVQGRFISPDPLMSSGLKQSPQTWNRYSYVLNNPLTYVDPTGAFTWDNSLGGSAADKDVSAEIRSGRQAVRDALAALGKKAASGNLSQSEAHKLSRAVQAYGAEGVNNGVTIAVGKSSRESVMGTASNRLAVGNDGTLSVSAKVTLDPTTFSNTAAYQLPDSVQARLAHEGDHVANAQTYAFFYNGALGHAGGDDRAAYEQSLQMMMNRDLTRFGNEMSAFTVTSIFLQASNWPATGEVGGSVIYKPEWAEADRAAARAKGIEEGLARHPSYGLVRGTNEGRRISDNIRKQ